MSFKEFVKSPVVKGFAHLFVSAAAVAAAAAVQSGAPVTSGNVLVPAVIAGLLAVGHAAFPSIINGK